MAVEHGPFVNDMFLAKNIKTFIQRGFSIAMFDYQRAVIRFVYPPIVKHSQTWQWKIAYS